jgi:hypothetical protein
VARGISTELDNGQTRLIAGIDDKIPFGKCTREILDLAIKNIEEYFAVVGILDKFNETILLLKKVFNWYRLPLYRKANVTKK